MVKVTTMTKSFFKTYNPSIAPTPLTLRSLVSILLKSHNNKIFFGYFTNIMTYLNLSTGFEPQLRRICESGDLSDSADRQTMMFSATFADNVRAVAQKYLKSKFARVEVGRVGSSIKSIWQELVFVEKPGNKKLKLDALVELLLGKDSKSIVKAGKGKNGPRLERTIVFTQKKATATLVKRMLTRDHYVLCEDIHGDRSQAQREAAL